MKKFLKFFCLVVATIITLSSVAMFFAVAKTNGGAAFDFLGCNDIIDNIKNLEINMTSVIYVQNKEGEWQEYQRIHGNENRIWIEESKMPKNLKNAFIAIEDQRFYGHRGVDWKRTVFAVTNKLLKFASVQGGSTITQQLIKNVTGDNARVNSRKAREIARALVIERSLSKDEILGSYLNTISLGNGICGVQVASNYYFNKDVSQLSLVECASLAAITKNPSAFNPETAPEGNKERRNVVLQEMLQQKLISEQEYEDAVNTELKLDDTQRKNFEIPINSYFVDALIEQLIADLSEKYGCSSDTASSMVYNGGYKIYATVDPAIQETMEKVYLNQKKYFSKRSRIERGKTVQSAMTVMDYNGHIVGLVGGVGEKTVNRGLNRAMSAPNQPGSTMKPLGVYALALDRGITHYSDSMVDSPLDHYYPDGKKGPQEWYGYYAGNMTLIKAIERSANTIPCKLLKDIGLEESYKFLTESLGMKYLSNEDKNLSALALGGCQYGITTTESAAAYAIFGNQGKYFRPTTYYKVERATGEVVLQADVVGKQVIKPATASVMNKLLQNVVYGSQGTGKNIANFSKNLKAFAKTGTTSDVYDLWMVGGSPYYVGSVWYGFDKNEEMSNNNDAATIWKAVMSEIHKDLEEKEFIMSDDLIEAKYCKKSGLLAGSKCYSKADGYFIPGAEVGVCSGKHSSASVESSSGSSSSSASSGSSTTSSTGDSSKSTSEATESSKTESGTASNSSSESTSSTPSTTSSAAESNS
ncbi:MAG: transglycosylase domain-containing protein [Clostridia bacterium]|nr:transglycosylase domain-containing protein [Clostridia bacterium]